jgi:hypothetical protein
MAAASRLALPAGAEPPRAPGTRGKDVNGDESQHTAVSWLARAAAACRGRTSGGNAAAGHGEANR